MNNDYNFVKDFFDKGLNAEFNINKKDANEKTALMHASINGNPRIVELLLEKGAKVDEKDNRKMTALLHASEGGHTKIVDLLLKKGAGVNLKNKGE